MRLAKYILIFATLNFSNSINAQNYFEFGIGQSSVEEDGIDESDTSISIGLTKFINENAGFEVSYYDHGKQNDKFVDAFGDEVEFDFEATSLRIGGRLQYPINTKINIFASAGFAFWDYDVSLTDSAFPGQEFTNDDNGNDIYYGFGIAADLSNQVTASVNYSDLGIESEGSDFTIENISLVIGYKFN